MADPLRTNGGAPFSVSKDPSGARRNCVLRLYAETHRSRMRSLSRYEFRFTEL